MNEHKAVLLNEAIYALGVRKNGIYVDATLGAGGHARRILENGGRVIGIDDDPKMLEIAKANLSDFSNVSLVNGNFRKIDKLLADLKINKVDGILADLGVSSVHFDEDDRGFSFKDERATLDMRLNKTTQEITGADLLNGLREDQLAQILGGKLALEIVASRVATPFKTVGDFVKTIRKVVAFSGKINPATKAFMALRIAVNTEEANLIEFLPKAYELLKVSGRMVVISFHSGEDRIVKDFFRNKKRIGGLVCPSALEIEKNPRARSARMRVVEKI